MISDFRLFIEKINDKSFQKMSFLATFRFLPKIEPVRIFLEKWNSVSF